MKQIMIRRFSIPFFLIIVVLLSACSGLANSEAINQPVAQTIEDTPALAEVEVEVEVLATEIPATEAQIAPSTSENKIEEAASILGQLSAQEQAFIATYKRVNPAVVYIDVGVGQGSGFIIDPAGYIVTNNHVVAEATGIVVTLADGETYPAQIVGTDPGSDLAVLKIEADAPLTAVSLADSNNLQVGQIVIAIGSPFGLSGTMTTGIISGLDRFFPADSGFRIPDIIQTDAAINPGNSGGPLLDLQGNVIGVNTAIESPVRGSSGIGYAVPANIVKAIIPQLIENGQAQYPWLGIAGVELNTMIQPEEIGLSAEQRGVLITAVATGGPADQADIRAGNPQSGLGGDVLVGVDGRTVEQFDDLLGYLIEETAVGQTITLEILRDGQIVAIPLTLQARP